MICIEAMIAAALPGASEFKGEILPKRNLNWCSPQNLAHKLSFLFAANRHTPVMLSLTNSQIRELKARSQLLKPTLKVGKEGLTPQFFAALDEALKHHDLLKVKFADLKDQKKELAPQLAEKTGSHLVMRVGNVAVLYRPKPTPAETRAE